MGVRLPAEYQEVEWIENTRDKSYWAFDIDSAPTAYKVRLCNSTGESWTGLSFTNAKSEFKDRFTIERESNNKPVFRFARYVNDIEVTAIPSVTNNTLSSLCEYDEGVCRVNSTIIGTLSMSGFEARALNIGGTIRAKRQTRFYYYEDDNRHLIPCYRKSDGIKGIYDRVSGLFNAGEGDQSYFAVGPDVIDSISPLMVAWRRGLMKEPELYPVGTNIRSLYNAVFISEHGIDTNTGEYVENSSRQASPVYMPISPKYTYWKRGTFPNRAYLSVLAFYDKDKNYISYYGKNDYNDFVIPDIPANARYARIAIPSGSANDIKIIRTA